MSVSSLVVKVGGSLLVRPELPAALRHWLAAQDDQQQLNLIIGGGPLIDSLRQLDRLHPLDAVAMHWRCVRALRHTLELVAEWIPEATVIDTAEAFLRHRSERRVGWYLVAADAFYHAGSGDDLPCDWTTTSDSIAALLATKLGAERLVLLKSCAIAEPLNIALAAAEGIIDPVFCRAVEERVVVELVCLAAVAPLAGLAAVSRGAAATSGDAPAPTGNRSSSTE